MFALRHAPRCRHQQGKAEVSGGLGQHIGRVGAQHAGSAHGGQVEIVVAHRHVGAQLELRALLQQVGVDLFRAGHEDTDLALQALRQLERRPDHIGLVGFDFKVLAELLQHLSKDGAGNEDGGLGHGVPAGWAISKT